jgi:hypothetical protein
MNLRNHLCFCSESPHVSTFSTLFGHVTLTRTNWIIDNHPTLNAARRTPTKCRLIATLDGEVCITSTVASLLWRAIWCWDGYWSPRVVFPRRYPHKTWSPRYPWWYMFQREINISSLSLDLLKMRASCFPVNLGEWGFPPTKLEKLFTNEEIFLTWRS